MKGLFGVVSLLIAVAIVGLIAKHQLAAVGHVAGAASSASAATAAEQSRQLQEQVRADVTKALEQGARRQEPDQ